MAKAQLVTTAEQTVFSLDDLQVEEFEVSDSRMGPERDIRDYPTCACCFSGGCCQCTCHPPSV